MCARFSLSDPGRIGDRWPGFKMRRAYLPRFNVAPTHDVLAACADGEVRELRWGLVPAWANDSAIGRRLINARAETLAEKPAFRDALRARRCVIFADGFYEWRHDGRAKRPFRFTVDHGRPFAFAGLHERRRRDGVTLETCAIVTCAPNQLLAPLHDRMPAILDDDALDAWLRGDVDDALAVVVPFDPDRMRATEVSPLVNRVDFDDPRCILPLTA